MGAGKSLNSSYGFRINFNRSGIGYSIESDEVKNLTSESYTDFIDEIKKHIRNNFIMNLVVIISGLGCIVNKLFAVLFIVSVLLKIYIRYFKKINMKYEYDDYGQEYAENINELMKIMSGNKKLWQVNKVYFNENKKENAGAASSVETMPIKLSKRSPYFIRTNADCYRIKLKKEILYILPDKILVVNKRNVAAIDTKSVEFYTGSKKFIEKKAVPSDALVIEHRWEHVNKNGSPDKRYKDNKKIPVCKYGRLAIKSSEGLNILFQCSDFNRMIDFRNMLINKIGKRCGDI